MNRLLNSSMEAKKPRRDPIQPQFNWRHVSRFNPGPGALNKVDTTWLASNSKLELFDDIKLKTKNDTVIELSKMLFEVPVSARTRITNLENLLERLKLTPHDVIINNGLNLDDDTPITSMKVANMKDYILVTQHNLDRIRPNTPAGLFPKLPFMMWSLSSPDDASYEITMVSPQAVADCYKHLAANHPTGAEGYLSLRKVFHSQNCGLSAFKLFLKTYISTKRDQLNEDLAAQEDESYQYPAGYEFHVDDAEGSSCSITNIFLKENITYSPTQAQIDNYDSNSQSHRRGQLGCLISRRGIFNNFSLYINYVTLGYPIQDMKRINNNMDLPTIEHTCKIRIISNLLLPIINFVLQFSLGMLPKYRSKYFKLEAKEAMTELRRARASMLSNCPQALRKLQENVIKSRSRDQPSNRPLTKAEMIQRINQPRTSSDNLQSPPAASSSPTSDNQVLARLIKLEQNSVSHEQLKTALNQSNLVNDKRFLEMQNEIDENRTKNNKLLHGYNELRCKVRENELNTKINRSLLSVQASITLSIDKRPAKLKSYNKIMKPVKPSNIAETVAAAVEADKRVENIKNNSDKMFVGFENMASPPSEPIKNPLPTPLVPYYITAASNSKHIVSDEGRLNLDNVDMLEPKLDHTQTMQIGSAAHQLSVDQNPLTNGNFQGKWSPDRGNNPLPPPLTPIKNTFPIFREPTTPKTTNTITKDLKNCSLINSPFASPRKRRFGSVASSCDSPKKVKCESPVIKPKPKSILANPLFNLSQFSKPFESNNWPTFLEFPNANNLPNKPSPDYIKYYNVAITQPDKLFEILTTTVTDLKPFISETNPNQTVKISKIIAEAEFFLANNFSLLHSALSNEVIFISLLDSDPKDLLNNYPAPPVSKILMKHILDSLTKMNVSLPNFTLENLLNYIRLCLVIDRPDYINKYFPDNQSEVNRIRADFLKKPMNYVSKNPTKVNPHLKVTPIREFLLRAVDIAKNKDCDPSIKSQTSSLITKPKTPKSVAPKSFLAKSSPAPKQQATPKPSSAKKRKSKTPSRVFQSNSQPVESSSKPTKSILPRKLSFLSEMTKPLSKSTSASDLQSQVQTKKLTKFNTITSLFKPPFLKDQDQNKPGKNSSMHYIDDFIKTNLSIFYKPWIYIMHGTDPTQVNSNDTSDNTVNLPNHDQLDHTTGDQAADHFFELDGFFIPENINKNMILPKPEIPIHKAKFAYRPSTNESYENLPLHVQTEIKTKLAKLQLKHRKKRSDMPPPLDTKIRIVSTNLNAPLKQFQKLILNTDYPEIVCINELKLTEIEFQKASFFPTIYTPYYTVCKYKHQKFVFSAIFVKNNLKASIKQISTPPPFTMIDIKLKLSNGESGDLNLCTFYRPHHKSKYQKLMNIKDDEYFKYFNDTFTKIFKLQTHKTCLLTGDLNCQYKNPRDCDNKQFAHFFESKVKSYKELTYKPTYTPTLTNDPNNPNYRKKSRIDPCLAKGLIPKIEQLPGRQTCNNDGHTVFKLDYDLKCILDHSAKVIHTFTKTNPIEIYHHSVTKFHEAESELTKLKQDAHDLLIERRKKGSFEALDKPVPYISKIISLFEETMDDLIKPIRVTINKFTPAPPLSTATKIARDNFHKLIELSSERPLSNSELYDLYRLDKEYSKMSRKDHKRHLVSTIENSQNRPLNQSQRYEVNRKVNKKNKNAVDDSLDLEKIADIFEKQINYFKGKQFVDYDFNLNLENKLSSNHFKIKWKGKSKRDSIYKAMLECKETTCGFESKLNKRVVGCFSNKYIDLILDMIYFCLELGYCPFEFRNSKIVPINKSKLIGSQKDQWRLRFLGIQSFLMQVMMKYVSNNYGHHIDKVEKLLPTSQHGFRNFFSTSSALNETFIRLNLTPKDKTPILLLIDIEKAFDSVCHKLLGKLLMETCEPNIARFLIDEHTNRSSYVVHNGIKSRKIDNPPFGVYQGGCMSPIEFALFLRDFTPLLKKYPFLYNILFADDVAVTCIGNTNDAINIITKVENNVKTYLKGINMDIQDGKTIIMLIGTDNKINVGTEDKPRMTTLTHKHLGVTFSNKLFDFKDKHPFEQDINIRQNKVIAQRGMLFQIENMGYHLFRKQLGYLLNYGVINYAFETLPILSDKLYNRLNKTVGQTIVDLWKLNPYPKVNYEYSHLFGIAKWANAQNTHTYSTLNNLNRTLMNRKPPLEYKEIMNIMYLDNKPYINLNSQLEFDKKLGHTNMRLGKIPKIVNDKNRIRSSKYYPYNLQHHFDKVPQYILSYLGTNAFKPLLSQHFKDICNHRAGKDNTCKYCINYKNYYNALNPNYELTTIVTTVPSYHRIHATTENTDNIKILQDKLYELALSLPFTKISS